MTRILIATGGTGGHIYPALVTGQELRRRGCEVIFAGTLGAGREKVTSQGFTCEDIVARGFVAKGALQKVGAIAAMAGALAAAMGMVHRRKPDIVVGFGGYSSFPVVAAALILRVPAMLHEQNAMPGQANRWLGRFVRRVAVGFREAAAFFPSAATVWTGNPLRPFDRQLSRQEACRELGLDAGRPVLMVFGGSQGSRSVNETVMGAVTALAARIPLQVIHLTGPSDHERVSAHYRALGIPSVVRDYLEHIGLAYAASDLVIARAGAGTVMELGLWRRRAVLIPYPGAGDHQKYNARVLAEAGLAEIIEEKSLRPDTLRDKIFAMIAPPGDGSPRPTGMSELDHGIESFIPDGAKRLADEILKLAPIRTVV